MFWAYPLLGAVVGLLAGMLGIGGGLIMVPVLSFIFEVNGFPRAYILHLALGTGAATIVFTSVSSIRSHHTRAAVRWDIVRRIAPGVVLGTLAGSVTAGLITSAALSVIFTVMVFAIALNMLFGGKPAAQRELPDMPAMTAIGAFIGAVSSFAALGGAILSVPLMLKCGVRMQHAVGTAAAIGFPIACAGAGGYMLMGAGRELPPHCIGFVYLPALAGIVVASLVTAPIGARIAHRLPAEQLRKIFALFALALAVRMLWNFV